MSGGQERNLLTDLPPTGREVLVLQLKPKWSKADHDRMAKLAKDFTPVHRGVFEDRFADRIGRAIRWK